MHSLGRTSFLAKILSGWTAFRGANVPLNYSDPGGEQASIALVRKPALVPKSSKFYRGPVLFNPGGPGFSGVDLIVQIGDLFASILGPQFDIVGFDSRGVGRSFPRASFFKTDVERALWGPTLLSMLGTVSNNSYEGIARTWASARLLGQLAAENDDGYLKHINTDQTARDMLRIVEAHGREKIQYWGFSYGSVLGASFAAMFPDKVERLVLDGVMDAENYYATLWSNSLLDTDKGLDQFFSGCAEAGPLGCAFWAPTADDVRQNFTNVIKTIRAHPLPVKTDLKYGILDYNSVRLAIFISLYAPYNFFQFLAQGLAELAAGDGRRLLEFVKAPPFQCSCDPSQHLHDVVWDAQTAILCNDGDDIPDDLESTQEYFERMANTSSWADIWSPIRLSCVGWPKFPKDHFQGPFDSNTSHPILLVGNTADPVTPLASAKKMSHFFNGSVVLTQDSSGHCSYSSPSVCTQKYVRDYFVHGTLPEPGTVCKPIGKPFPPLPVSSDTQVPFVAEEDKELFNAVQQLSKIPFIPFPLRL
ncbi:hypothetical protein NLJ89_g9828 [Agrocybe chaxingu]|uniref:Peptidase S33 tripeptidyl aminopeptidase-like C-terminal domain-containing protein n=1 Tax=Agrocybe chaxingu TaxID=84603 RepID=A0A9W8JV73_9AGAR|nr:hypothetical protein NLJ89_g9828 [Agrocybe chaxingu]